MLRARITSAFVVTGQSTFVGVEILDGAVEVGDQMELPLVDGHHRVVEVRAIEFIDHIAEGKAEAGLSIVGVEPGEILIGGRGARAVRLNHDGKPPPRGDQAAA